MCQNTIHLTAGKLQEVCNIGRRGQDETPGDQWNKIFKIAVPGVAQIPPPYEPTTCQLEALARNPPRSLIEHLATNLFDGSIASGHGTHHEVEIVFNGMVYFIDFVRRTGALPDDRSSLRIGSAGTGEFVGAAPPSANSGEPARTISPAGAAVSVEPGLLTPQSTTPQHEPVPDDASFPNGHRALESPVPDFPSDEMSLSDVSDLMNDQGS